MRRLRDESAPPSAELASLAELVKTSQPIARSEARAARVREAIATGRSRRARPAMVLRPAGVIAIVALATIASAMAVTAIRRAQERDTTPTPAPVVSLPIAAPAVVAPSTVAASPTTVVAAPTTVATPPSATSPPRRKDMPDIAVDTSAATREAALVATAVKVLRSEKDADKALVLFEDYLRLHPSGVLVEEVYSLAMEAAAARHDDEERARFGREYLERYPQGRFRQAAEKAIGH